MITGASPPCSVASVANTMISLGLTAPWMKMAVLSSSSSSITITVITRFLKVLTMRNRLFALCSCLWTLLESLFALNKFSHLFKIHRGKYTYGRCLLLQLLQFIYCYIEMSRIAALSSLLLAEIPLVRCLPAPLRRHLPPRRLCRLLTHLLRVLLLDPDWPW